MRTFEFKKIIRDGILSNMLEEGCEVVYERLSGRDRREKLIDKLEEETDELQTTESKEEMLEELNDVRLVMEAIIASLNSEERKQFEQLHQEKLDKKGGFSEATWVDSVSVPSDSPWIEYFETKPDKYPEITE